MTHKTSFFSPVQTPNFAPLRAFLAKLRMYPPQVILLEGGIEEERQALARYWAASIHCPQHNPPCLTCSICQQIESGQYRDVLAYDGRISNKEDEENPGVVRAFNIENVRQLKSRLHDAPHGAGKRVVMLSGLDLTRDEAANALLKVLEEPSATTVFVLMAAQREQLLPTLVSRSWVLTLPWPDPTLHNTDIAQWEQALAGFLQHGTGFLEKTATRGAVTPILAAQLLLACQKALSAVLQKKTVVAGGVLQASMTHLSLEQCCAITTIVSRAQDALQDNVNPARVLDWLAVNIYAIAHKSS